MKVLLVNPLRYMKDNHVFPPVHLLYIAQSIRRAGHEAEIVDLPYLLDMHPRQYRLNDDSGIEHVLSKDFDMLGIGSVVSSYFYVERLLKAVREHRGDVPIIVGGSVGYPARDLYAEHAPVDFLCEGDGEVVIESLVKSYPDDMDAVRSIPGLHWLDRETGSYVGNEPDLPRDLDHIPFVTYDEVDVEYFMDQRLRWVKEVLNHGNYTFSDKERFLPIIFSRGCVYDCTFCFHFNRRHRRHSPAYVADNIEFLMERYGATAFAPLDDLIIIDKRWLGEVCDEIVGRGIRTSFFSGGGKPSIVDKPVLEKMKAAGFKRISYGIESGSQTILDVMNKGTTVADNHKAIALTREVGIPFSVNIVFGMPGETITTMNETRDFLIGLDVNSKDYYAALATPYPGCKLFTMAREAGVVPEAREYLINLGGCADYRYNLTEMPMHRFKNHVLDVAYRVDLAYYRKRRAYRKVFALIGEKYGKMLYYALVPPDARAKIQLSNRFGWLGRLLFGSKADRQIPAEEVLPAGEAARKAAS